MSFKKIAKEGTLYSNTVGKLIGKISNKILLGWDWIRKIIQSPKNLFFFFYFKYFKEEISKRYSVPLQRKAHSRTQTVREKDFCVPAHPRVRGRKKKKTPLEKPTTIGLDTEILILNIEILTSHCKWGGIFRIWSFRILQKN